VTPENDILRACKQYLELKGCVVVRHNQIPVPLPGGGYRRFSGTKGVSDLLCCLPGGRFLAAEIKSKTGRATEDQILFQKRISDAGGLACVVRSVDQLAFVLEENGYG
jgi:hypothetical protein